MELSIFLAKTWGLYISIVRIALLSKRSRIEILIKELKSDLMLLLSGTIALGVGIAQVVAHNLWVGDWRVIITILGWAAALKGVFLLFYPRLSPQIAKTIIKSGFYQYLLGFYILVGIYLMFIGFGY